MLFALFLVTFLVSSPVFTAVVKQQENLLCRVEEFECGDGGCLSLDRICDGNEDCADGSDEATCFGRLSHSPIRNTVLTRSKRQAGKCRKNQWECRNGQCISFDGKCDGVVNCQDKSDETHALCRKSQCQSNWFRCTYGACVDGTAPCNGVQDCADNSDELLPRCRNDTDEVRGRFKCANGDTIAAAEHCDGIRNCKDGSDETVRSCAAKTCPSYLFQCAYGACVDQGADCNGITDCADGSDESDELCNRMGNGSNTSPTPTGDCILPPYPDHGRYTVGGAPEAAPGQGFQSYQLNVTCNPGYAVVGDSSFLCFNGMTIGTLPECVRVCRLTPHPSVEYFCDVDRDGVIGTRACRAQEPSGTIVTPKCRTPNYYYSGVLNKMTCIDGNWDYVARCTPECGRLTPGAVPLIVNGVYAKKGELPWHTGIYSKTSTPYKQICGGSLVTTTVVISAAHCFWSEFEKKPLPASNYAAAVGKLYRPWNSPRDPDAQKSDVSDIRIPARFQGVQNNYQQDLAIVILVTAIEYKTYVRPVCIDFDIGFENRQLRPGAKGKIAGWGFTSADGDSSVELLSVELPYVEFNECFANSPPNFREFITVDKMCAGYINGTAALCKGDSGGGLVFPEDERGVIRHYLRGVVSTAAPDEQHKCNVNTLTTFTQITQHEMFIKQNVRLGF